MPERLSRCRRIDELRPLLDDRSRGGARRVALPEDPEELAALVDGDELARFADGVTYSGKAPRRGG